MSFVPETKYYCDGCENKCEIKIVTRYHGCGRPAGTYAKISFALATMEVQIDSDFTRKIYIPMLIDQALDLARRHCLQHKDKRR